MQQIVAKVRSGKLSNRFILMVERRRELTQESVGVSGLKAKTVGLYQFCHLEFYNPAACGHEVRAFVLLSYYFFLLLVFK